MRVGADADILTLYDEGLNLSGNLGPAASLRIRDLGAVSRGQAAATSKGCTQKSGRRSSVGNGAIAVVGLVTRSIPPTIVFGYPLRENHTASFKNDFAPGQSGHTVVLYIVKLGSNQFTHLVRCGRRRSPTKHYDSSGMEYVRNRNEGDAPLGGHLERIKRAAEQGITPRSNQCCGRWRPCAASHEPDASLAR